MTPVKLQEWQIDWATKAVKILETNNGYVDTSSMRSGKTYVALWLAQKFNLKLFIVCPVTTMSVWKKTAIEYGVEVVDIISYQSLRGQTDHQPKNNFLDRTDEIIGKNKKTEFTATQDYLDLLPDGILLIYDEVHNIKNNSAQYKACRALVEALINSETGSRFALLSGTLLDKTEQVVNLLRMIGYIRSRNLYRVDKTTGAMVLEGLQELIDECAKINFKETQKITDKILKETPLYREELDTLCYELYTNVIKETISGGMNPPIIDGVLDVRNGFYNINAKSAVALAEGVSKLGKAAGVVKNKKTLEIVPKSIGKKIVALVEIENAKAIDMARIAEKNLMLKKSLKVVISVNYTTTINIIKEILSKWNPLILNGEVLESKRSKVIESFVEDPNFRVIIMNTVVGGVGISLYSTEKNQDRLMLISPSYRMIEITQAAARIFGPGMQSDAKVRLFYGKCPGCDELAILTALARKTSVLKGVLDDSAVSNLKLPGDYQKIREK